MRTGYFSMTERHRQVYRRSPLIVETVDTGTERQQQLDERPMAPLTRVVQRRIPCNGWTREKRRK